MIYQERNNKNNDQYVPLSDSLLRIKKNSDELNRYKNLEDIHILMKRNSFAEKVIRNESNELARKMNFITWFIPLMIFTLMLSTVVYMSFF